MVYKENDCANDCGIESDVQCLVKHVLQSAIYTVCLKGKVKCFNERSIFDLLRDIWLVCASAGVPIGVVDVKKPGNDKVIQRILMYRDSFYMNLDEHQWSWGPIAVKDESSLCHSVLVTAWRFSAGSQRTCMAGLYGCWTCLLYQISNAHTKRQVSRSRRTADANKEQREKLACCVGTQVGSSDYLAVLSIMRFLRPLTLQDDGTLIQEDRSSVKTAIEQFAAKGLVHKDLVLRHVGLLSPP